MIVGLVGFKHSGKSTVAKYLESKYGFYRHNFKDALIEEIKQNFPDLLREIAKLYTVSTERLNNIDWPFEEKPTLIRALMQNYGTEVRRNENVNYWVNKWETALRDMSARRVLPENIVTDDVRFLNEAKVIKVWDGIIIRVICTGINDGGSHESETQQTQIVADHTIEVAYGEHDKLQEKIDEIMAKYN